MTRFEMNFASHQSRSRFVLVILVIGFVGSLSAIWSREELILQRDVQQDELRRLERSLSHHQFSGGSRSRQNPKAVIETKRLIMELQRPWEAMLNSLQKAAKPDMLILRIQPESDANRLLISGQADNNQAFLSYLARLRADVSWLSVEPISEERALAVVMPAGKPVSFQLRVERRSE